jgi:hypothetical protein
MSDPGSGTSTEAERLEPVSLLGTLGLLVLWYAVLAACGAILLTNLPGGDPRYCLGRSSGVVPPQSAGLFLGAFVGAPSLVVALIASGIAVGLTRRNSRSVVTAAARRGPHRHADRHGPGRRGDRDLLCLSLRPRRSTVDN